MDYGYGSQIDDLRYKHENLIREVEIQKNKVTSAIRTIKRVRKEALAIKKELSDLEEKFRKRYEECVHLFSDFSEGIGYPHNQNDKCIHCGLSRADISWGRFEDLRRNNQTIS